MYGKCAFLIAKSTKCHSVDILSNISTTSSDNHDLLLVYYYTQLGLYLYHFFILLRTLAEDSLIFKAGFNH